MEIALFVLSVFSISLLIAYVYASHNLKKTTAMLAETVLIYLSDIKSAEQPQKDSESIHKENFIKFLSDSRDWAYDYIENVQKGLSEFISEVEPSIEYFKEYGIIVDGSPHYRDMKIISDNFDKLKRLLPEDTDDRR